MDKLSLYIKWITTQEAHALLDNRIQLRGCCHGYAVQFRARLQTRNVSKREQQSPGERDASVPAVYMQDAFITANTQDRGKGDEGCIVKFRDTQEALVCLTPIVVRWKRHVEHQPVCTLPARLTCPVHATHDVWQMELRHLRCCPEARKLGGDRLSIWQDAPRGAARPWVDESIDSHHHGGVVVEP